jgi:endonuclease/exonuclease/phosphatase (EEP) superfamily protein YafD
MRLWGLITSAGIVAGAATLLGFLGSLAWFLDLCSHFRVQYFLMRIPIDHCLFSPGIRILSKEVGPRVGSDHFPVIVDFLIER